MATLEEVLAEMSDENYAHDDIQFMIDENLRTISIPSRGVVLGVVEDKDVNRVDFMMDRYYNGFDMSKFEIRVNYVNANGDRNWYSVKDIIVNEETIIFSWLVAQDATAYMGTVRFLVRMLKLDGAKILQDFHTTLAEATVLEGLSVEIPIDPDDAYDMLANLKNELQETVKAEQESAAKSASDAAKSAEAAAEDRKTIEDTKNKLEDIDKKANIADPVFTGSMSMGRKENSAVGIGSVALGLDIQAVGDYTIGVGVSTYAGCKAYYMKSIDMTAKIIYLCKEKNTFPEMNTQDNTDASFDTPSYEIGDEFSIINGNHYVLCAKITSISNNAIGYDVDLPFHSFDQDDFSELDGHTFFVPSKPNIGAVVITNSSFASGVNNIAAGTGSEVAGKNNIAASSYGHVEGRNNIAGYTSHAEGMFNDARGESSHVEGNTCKALGQNSHAEGNDSIARGESSHVEGRSCSAVGNFAHSEGDHNTATGNGSHSEGYDNEASGNQSHAEGKGNQASGDKSHAEGEGNVVSGYAGHAEGGGNQASGNCSHAEGSNTTAKGASSHTEGYFTTAEGVSSHSEGYSTIANGDCSHAEGHGTKATGESSHAEGLYTKATHPNSHAEGDTTEAAGTCQHVQGKYNVVDTEGKYAHIVGNGTSSSNRSNAHTVDWDGNAWFAGKASQEAEPTEDKDLATVKWVRDLLEATTGVLESMIGEGIA